VREMPSSAATRGVGMSMRGGWQSTGVLIIRGEAKDLMVCYRSPR
jgi:hypothetical protein